LTEAEKEAKRQSSLAFWRTPKGMRLREERRQARILYNKTKVDERLSPASRKKLRKRLIKLNKTRVQSKAERRATSKRCKALAASGGMKRGPMTDAEKKMHSERMVGNQFGLGYRHTKKFRRKASKRMKANNPMHDEAALAQMMATKEERYGENYYSEHFKRMWAEGKINTVPTFLGFGRPANKTESALIPMLEKLGAKFRGDGTFWIGPCVSGHRRNPDFVFGSGKKKMALLVHGTYWHRDEEAASLQTRDYEMAGWNLFVLWVKDLKEWVLPAIEVEIRSWLKEIKSSQLRMPVTRQFMTWNVTRTTTSLPVES
jgi:hypothetical protein